MIRIKNYCHNSLHFTAEYVADIRTVRIISDSIADDSCCCRCQLNAFVWTSCKGDLLGVECVFPSIIKSNDCIYLQGLNLEVNSYNGMLIVETFCEDKIGILWMDQNAAGHYVLVLDDKKKANKKFCSENVDFYVCDDILVSIEIKDGKHT